MMLHEEKPSLEEVLEHYGVKGMKWGVRKAGGAAKKSAKQQVDFYKPAGRLAKKGAKAAGSLIAKSAKQQVDFYKPAGRLSKKGAKAAKSIISKSAKQQIDFYKRDN